MSDKNLIAKIQNDINKSNAKMITNDDDEEDIKKKFSSKYTEDISDSDEDDDLTSYKNRNINTINKLTQNDKNKENNKTKKIHSTKNVLKSKSEQNSNHESDTNSNPKPKPTSNQDSDNKSGSGSGSGSNSDSEHEHEYEYSEEFKKKVVQYVKNDNRIRELQTELKNLNAIKKNAEVEILKHLERLGESNINITGGKLRVNKYESKEGLKEEIIKEALSEKIKDPKIIEFIFEKINQKRVSGGKVQVSLKRTFERGGKDK